MHFINIQSGFHRVGFFFFQPCANVWACGPNLHIHNNPHVNVTEGVVTEMKRPYAACNLNYGLDHFMLKVVRIK